MTNEQLITRIHGMENDIADAREQATTARRVANSVGRHLGILVDAIESGVPEHVKMAARRIRDLGF
jgi:uncharacterized protein YigA (DUF484 family)